MTDKQMIERVARKLAMFLFDTYGDAEGVVWAGLDTYDREKAFKAAQAALSAITPPNGDEVREALEEAREFVVIHGPAAAFPDLLAKINAALAKEKLG